MAPSEKPIGSHEPCCVWRNFAPAHGDPAAASPGKSKKLSGNRGQSYGVHFFKGRQSSPFPGGSSRPQYVSEETGDGTKFTFTRGFPIRCTRCRVLLRTTKASGASSSEPRSYEWVMFATCKAYLGQQIAQVACF